MDRLLSMVNEDQARNTIPSATDAFNTKDVIPTMATPVATALVVRATTVTLRNVTRTVRGAEVAV